VVGANEELRGERRQGTRGLMSLLGVVVPRLIYQAVGSASLVPLDVSLDLPKESTSGETIAVAVKRVAQLADGVEGVAGGTQRRRRAEGSPSSGVVSNSGC
jgi:hypothetical protein